MRKSILTTMLVLPLLVVVGTASDCLSFEPNGQSYGFSSEEPWGGGAESYLGVDTRDVTADRLGALGLKEEKGVEVTMVDQDAPAGKAGLKEHDVILSINGQEVESVEQLRRMIREIPPGRVVTIGVSRNGQSMNLKAQLTDRKQTFVYTDHPGPQSFQFSMPAMPSLPDMDLPVSVVVVHSSARSGLMVENLTSQLGEFFGIKNGQGVLVRSVDKGSRAERSGFRAGDVITKVNGEAINDTGDFTHALRSHKDNPATVSVIRDKKEQTLTLSLPDRNHSEVFDESFEVPEIDAETRLQLDEVRSRVAQIKPQIEEQIERIKPEMDELMQKKLKKDMEQMQRDLREQQKELQEELKREFHELQSESEI
jgi:serine protease Do